MLTSATPLTPYGWFGIRHLDHDRLDHRQVGRDRDAVVEEARDSTGVPPRRRCIPRSAPSRCPARRRPGSGPRHSSDGWRGRRPARRRSAGSSPCRSRDRPRRRRTGWRSRAHWPSALTPAAATIGPPVAGALGGDLLDRHRLEVADIAARRPRVAVLPDHALGIDSPRSSRRARTCPAITILVASTTAMPVAKVTREPPVTCV